MGIKNEVSVYGNVGTDMHVHVHTNIVLEEVIRTHVQCMSIKEGYVVFMF